MTLEVQHREFTLQETLAGGQNMGQAMARTELSIKS